MSKIERGIYVPTLTNFIKIVSVLNISLSEFNFPKIEEKKSSRRELLELIQASSENEIEYFLTIFKATKTFLKK